VTVHGVRIVGLRNYPGRVAVDATRMYANNIAGLAQIICDKEAGAFKLDRADDIVAGA
jgi:NAD(P) transhydrogenase subunit alpha